MNNMNSGYSGYSMSNRAVEAYESGEKPMSKWTKSEIIESIEEIIDELNIDYTIDDLKTLKANELRSAVLEYSSWHHTSSYANATDFYRISIDRLSDLTKEEIRKIKAESKKNEKKKGDDEYRAKVRYLDWIGTRKHPKAIEIEDEGLIRGNWFYKKDGSKKSINGRGFRIIEKKPEPSKKVKFYVTKVDDIDIDNLECFGSEDGDCFQVNDVLYDDYIIYKTLGSDLFDFGFNERLLDKNRVVDFLKSCVDNQKYISTEDKKKAMGIIEKFKNDTLYSSYDVVGEIDQYLDFDDRGSIKRDIWDYFLLPVYNSCKWEEHIKNEFPEVAKEQLGRDYIITENKDFNKSIGFEIDNEEQLESRVDDFPTFNAFMEGLECVVFQEEFGEVKDEESLEL